MRLSQIVDAYMADIPAGIVLGRTQIERTLKNAVRLFCAYAVIASAPPAEGQAHTAIDATNSIASGQDFDLSPSEYGIIGPLFRLYVERENAMNLEASRALGLDVFGRQVSEIEQEIRQYETELPSMAFSEPIVTV